MLWLSFALSYLAMTLLSLAMPRHHKTLFGAAPVRGRVLLLRLLAGVGLIAALLLCLAQLGGEIGAVIWLCQLMLAGVLLVLLLAWRKRWILPVAALLPAASGLSLLLF
ncbi:DUF3325 domain-containing protein [Pseudomonas sp. LS44]|uniref:DUF3325 domain-containing protein n=1 Tax=Pseudomonas sp. LS44 TaxID=1357074 RepID=UPI00215A5764|nr:DUF3325 domain-containing protein [Pseudomonas sp. LS44]UVE16890.1 DUF3325 domain-containing protein [Pseudomonas sp. LS44]